jgi:uncharacterized membrane protein YphA (DoxX/SURF4 family)
MMALGGFLLSPWGDRFFRRYRKGLMRWFPWLRRLPTGSDEYFEDVGQLVRVLVGGLFVLVGLLLISGVWTPP